MRIKQLQSVRPREKNKNAYGQKEKGVFFPFNISLIDYSKHVKLLSRNLGDSRKIMQIIIPFLFFFWWSISTIFNVAKSQQPVSLPHSWQAYLKDYA